MVSKGRLWLIKQPATLNAAEWKSLCEVAKSKKLFLMEGEFHHLS